MNIILYIMRIMDSGRLPQRPHGSMNWLSNTKLNVAITYNEQITI